MSQLLIKPPPLPEGGTVGVAAASSPFENRSEIDRGIRWYEERGYHVKLARGVHSRDDYVAGDAPQWRKINGWITQQHVGGIIMSVGSPLEIAAKWPELSPSPCGSLTVYWRCGRSNCATLTRYDRLISRMPGLPAARP